MKFRFRGNLDVEFFRVEAPLELTFERYECGAFAVLFVPGSLTLLIFRKRNAGGGLLAELVGNFKFTKWSLIRACVL